MSADENATKDLPDAPEFWIREGVRWFIEFGIPDYDYDYQILGGYRIEDGESAYRNAYHLPRGGWSKDVLATRIAELIRKQFGNELPDQYGMLVKAAREQIASLKNRVSELEAELLNNHSASEQQIEAAARDCEAIALRHSIDGHDAPTSQKFSERIRKHCGSEEVDSIDDVETEAAAREHFRSIERRRDITTDDCVSWFTKNFAGEPQPIADEPPLPMVGGRPVEVMPSTIRSGWLIYARNSFLNHAATWNSPDETDDGNYWPSRQAAIDFIRECVNRG